MMPGRVGIIDCDIGNIGSLLNMLDMLQIEAKVVSQPSDLDDCSRVIFPGVGAFDSAMKKLTSSGLAEALHTVILNNKIPILGICVGAQLMCLGSAEGHLEGLGWISSELSRFDPELVAHIPHMGWNYLERNSTSKWPVIAQDAYLERFYFTHSYYIPDNCPDAVAYSYCGIRFTAAFRRENIYGVQFHPEKSHRHGVAVIQQFCEQL